MEDYTYDLEPGKELSLGAHMLEVCPSVAAESRASRYIRWVSAARLHQHVWSLRDIRATPLLFR